MSVRTMMPWVAIAMLACSPPDQTEAPQSQSNEPWQLAPVEPDTSDGIRILVLHDMEGLSGQSDPKTFDFGNPEYPTGQELLAADINAVIQGLYVGGATEVHVVDGHGSGNPDPDVRRDLLDPRATQILRDERFDAYFDLVLPDAYDAVAVVGMHAKTGSRGFASHTFTLGIGIEINGQLVTETELVAASWGRHSIPVIFASGDDRLAADLATMPWIEFVTVKTALAADTAAPRPVAEARADLTAAAQRAVENLREGATRAIRVGAPLRAGLKAVPPASLAMLDGIPGIEYADSTVRFVADSLGHAYQVLGTLVGVATRNYSTLLGRVASTAEDGPALLRRYGAELERTWFDYESGRWTAPTRPPTTPRKYHGYQ